MKELLSIYKKQSVVERNWRCFKDKRLLVNTLYFESSSRINALMWVMTLALLIYSATEYLMRKKMEEQRLTRALRPPVISSSELPLSVQII